MIDRDPPTSHGTCAPERAPARPTESGNGKSAVIARLEGATEGSRELDVRVYLTLFDKGIMTDGGGYRGERPVQFTPARAIWTDDWPHWHSRSDVESAAMELECPHYSTSIDAALTLFPPFRNGYLWCQVERYANGCGRVAFFGSTEYVEAATPALALCIAALKARARPATPDLMRTEPARRA